MKTIADLDQELRAAGLPIAGVTQTAPETAHVTSWQEGITPSPAQQTQADFIIANFDWNGLTVQQLKQQAVRDMAVLLEHDDAHWENMSLHAQRQAMQRVIRAAGKMIRLLVS